MPVQDFCIIAPAPVESVYEYTSGVNDGKVIVEPVPFALLHIVRV